MAGEENHIESYSDSYRKEINSRRGTPGTPGSAFGSTESSYRDEEEIVAPTTGSIGLLDDNSLGTDVKRALAAGGTVSPPRGFLSSKKKKPQVPLFHSYFDQLLQNEASISYNKSYDDHSISTLGEESIKRRPSPLNADSPLSAYPPQKPFGGRPSVSRPIALEKIRTRSTLKARPSEDSEEAQHRMELKVSSADSIASEERKTTWKIIKLILGSSLILLTAAGVVLAICFIKLNSNDESSGPFYEPWFPRVRTPNPTSSPSEILPEPSSQTSAPIDPNVATNIARQDLLQLISTVSPDSLSSVGDTSSPQYRAYEWAVNDPEYLNYSVERIVQRWSMAVLYFSTGGDEWKTDLYDSSNITDSGNFTEWLDESHECLWYSTDESDVCNEDSEIVAIHLSNNGLSGTIPPEIHLLAGSLERLYLSGNSLSGTIPFEIGYLSNLVRLQLTGNEIGGAIPFEISLLSNLRVLGLGKNQITGNIPSVLGNLESLGVLGLEGNALGGTIPSSLSRLSNLESLVLEANKLVGPIPSALGMLEELNVFSIHQNNLVGAIPPEFCMTNETISLTADCDTVECECCELCCFECDGEGGVLIPTTEAPTASPCETKLSLTNTCYEKRSDFITVNFENCGPGGMDWIGLFSEEDTQQYSVGSPAPDDTDAWLWTRACGDRECNQLVESGGVNLGNGGLRLPEGEYRVIFVSRLVTVAMSETITISKNC